jgi:hypothetical protein
MPVSRKTVIFSAPQAWGKTSNAEKLRRQHRCKTVVDDWAPGVATRPGALHLTNAHPQQIPASSAYEVISLGW